MLGVMIGGAMLAGGMVYATPDDPICKDEKATSTDKALAGCTVVCSDPQIPEDLKDLAGCNLSDKQTAPNMAQTLINVVLTLVGVLAVGIIIYGGVLYMTSAGDLGKVQRGKHTLIYGVAGMLVCLLAAAIVNFVIFGVTS